MSADALNMATAMGTQAQLGDDEDPYPRVTVVSHVARLARSSSVMAPCRTRRRNVCAPCHQRERNTMSPASTKWVSVHVRRRPQREWLTLADAAASGLNSSVNKRRDPA